MRACGMLLLTATVAFPQETLFNTGMYESPAAGETPGKGRFLVYHEGEGKPGEGYFKKHEPGEIAEFHVFVPDDVDPKRRYPLLIVYHGGKDGGSGKGLCRRMARLSTKEHPLLVLSPNMYTLEGYKEILAEKKYPIDTGRVMVIGFSSGGMGVRAAMLEYLQSGGAFTPATLVCASTTASIGRTKYPPVPYVVMAGEKETAEHMKHPLLKTRRSTCRKHAVEMQQVFREVRYIEMQGRGHGAGSPEHQAVFLNLLRALPAWRIKLSLRRVPPELEALVAQARSADWIALKRALATLDRAKHWQRELAARSRYLEVVAQPPSETLRADLQALLEEMPETEFGGNRVKEKLLALQG